MRLLLEDSSVRNPPHLAFGAPRCSEAYRTAQERTLVLSLGAASFPARSRRVEILSWVPLGGRLAMSVPASGHRRLSKLGVILRHNRSAATAQRWLKQRFNTPTHVVNLEYLVDGGALKTGLSSKLPELLRAAT